MDDACIDDADTLHQIWVQFADDAPVEIVDSSFSSLDPADPLCVCEDGFVGARCAFTDAATCSGHGAALRRHVRVRGGVLWRHHFPSRHGVRGGGRVDPGKCGADGQSCDAVCGAFDLDCDADATDAADTQAELEARSITGSRCDERYWNGRVGVRLHWIPASQLRRSMRPVCYHNGPRVDTDCCESLRQT